MGDWVEGRRGNRRPVSDSLGILGHHSMDGTSLPQVAYFAHLAHLAYAPQAPSTASAAKCSDCPEHGYRAYHHAAAHTITIVCRGTQSVQDAIDDLKVAATTDESGKLQLHQGFYLRARAVLSDLPNRFQDTVMRSCKFDVTGHSLGGAVAVVLGCLLQQHGYRVRRIVTFGQPRVFKQGCRPPINVLRVVNDKDLVTRLPPKSAGFDHLSSSGLLLSADGSVSYVD